MIGKRDHSFGTDLVTTIKTACADSAYRHTSSSERKQIPALPWDSIVPKRYKVIETYPSSSILELIRNAAEYMKEVLQYDTFVTAKKVAELIVTKYPKVFASCTWTGDGTVLKYSTGVRSLQMRIYDRLREMEFSEKKRKRTDENDKETSEEIPIRRLKKRKVVRKKIMVDLTSP